MRKLKMSNKSKIGLDKSITHWKDVKKNDSQVGPTNCELCTLYQCNIDGHISCRSCPVYKKSKATGCHNTPYYTYVNNTPYYTYVNGRISQSESIRKKLAQDEIDFLESCYY